MPKSLDETLSEPGKAQTATNSGRSMEGAKKASDDAGKDEKNGSNKQGITFAAQDKLPKLPIPELEGSLKRYLQALKPLQSAREQAETQQAVDEFLKSDGPELQDRLKKYADGKTSYIEQFCKNFDAGCTPDANYPQGTIHI